MKQTLINLTPHTITIVTKDGERHIAPCGEVARLTQSEQKAGEIDGVEIYKAVFGEIENLPQPKEGVCYIVSALVATKAKRADVFSPFGLIRDKDGNVVGAKGLQKYI